MDSAPSSSAQKPRAPRRDAQARREALITAAAEAFVEGGYRVPLEEIADRAGVGRATLYRNFKDREALALAIFAREVDRIGAVLDPAAPIEHTILGMVRSGAKVSALFARISSELEFDDDSFRAFKALGTRLADLLAPTVAAAKARGELRPDIAPEHVVTGLRMVGGLLKSHHKPEEAEAEIALALDLLMRGMRPR